MSLLRTIVATAIVTVWAAVILEGAIRGTYGAPVAAMTPVVSIAVGYLLGRDAIEAFRRRGRDPREGDAE